MASESDRPSQDDVTRALISAIADLYQEDGDLLALGANERSITHKLAEHLQRRFQTWNVDCEYNRRGANQKRLQMLARDEAVDPSADEAVTVYPDVIVHRRNRQENLAVVEVKKQDGAKNSWDREKVESFSGSPEYAYENGFVLTVGKYRPGALERYTRGGGGWVDLSDDLLRALEERDYAG